MTRLLWHATMSLDGFIAAPGDVMDWAFKHAGPDRLVDDVLATTGALLVGRRSYEVGQRAQRAELKQPYAGAWSGPQLVLTHRPPATPIAPNLTFLSGEIRDAVSAAERAAAGKNVVLIGATVARQCMAASLVNEILVHVAPILLGDGIRFFDLRGHAPIELEKLDSLHEGQRTTLRFRVVPRR